MDCPKCQSKNNVKNGIAGNRQRYRGKNCFYNYTFPQRGKPKEMKKMALRLYLEGLGLRSIGRLLSVSHVSVMNWIKNFGEKLEELESDNQLEVVEMDEMHTYIGAKKTIVGYGLLLTDLENNL